MKPHCIAFAVLFLALAACTPRSPADAVQPTDATPPAATATPIPLPTPLPQDAAGKRAPGDESLPLEIVRAFGNEPFWNVNVENTTLTYTTPEDQSGVVMEGTRRTLADGVEISGQHDGKAFVLTVGSGTCSDGMSDIQHSMVSTFRYGEIDYKGCGEAAK